MGTNRTPNTNAAASDIMFGPLPKRPQVPEESATLRYAKGAKMHVWELTKRWMRFDNMIRDHGLDDPRTWNGDFHIRGATDVATDIRKLIADGYEQLSDKVTSWPESRKRTATLDRIRREQAELEAETGLRPEQGFRAYSIGQERQNLDDSKPSLDNIVEFGRKATRYFRTGRGGLGIVKDMAAVVTNHDFSRRRLDYATARNEEQAERHVRRWQPEFQFDAPRLGRLMRGASEKLLVTAHEVERQTTLQALEADHVTNRLE